MNTENKISVKQSFLLFILMFCAPAVRYFPLYSAQKANQAAWLSPFVALILLFIYVLIWNQYVKKYEKKSFLQIINDILGKFFGTVVGAIYFIWITYFLAYNVRMYAERILSSALPSVDISLLVLSMLVVVCYVLKNGINPLAKMAEIFFYVLTIIFVVYNVLVLPEIKLENMFPITHKDILPIINGCAPIISIFGYSTVLFMFNDKIDHKGEFKKISIKSILIITFISFEVIMLPISVFSPEIVAKMPIPYLNTMMQISLFDTLERLESAIIMFWLLTDFMLIAIFIYSALHMIKITYKLQNINPLLAIYVIGIFFLSIIMASSSHELVTFSENILTPTNILIGYLTPILIYIVGKIRKKI